MRSQAGPVFSRLPWILGFVCVSEFGYAQSLTTGYHGANAFSGEDTSVFYSVEELVLEYGTKVGTATTNLPTVGELSQIRIRLPHVTTAIFPFDT